MAAAREKKEVGRGRRERGDALFSKSGIKKERKMGKRYEKKTPGKEAAF